MSSNLKEMAEVQGSSTRGGVVSLATSGRMKLPVTVGKDPHPKKPHPYFTHEKLQRLQVKTGTSDNMLKVFGNFLRVEAGRSAVEPGLDEFLTQRNSFLEDHFKEVWLKQTVKEKKAQSPEKVEQVVPNGKGKRTKKEGGKVKEKKVEKEVQKLAIVAKDVDELAALVMVARGLTPENSLIQIGLDDGQGFIKVMLTVKSKNVMEGPSKRAKYADGFSPQGFLYSSVKKLIIIGIIHSSESYDNIKALLESLKITALEFGFSTDLKMVLILCGKQVK